MSSHDYKDHDALASARNEAMNRFLHDYDMFVRTRGDDYWQYSSTRMDDGDGHQFILNLEMEDDA
jgi:hypothetical protein